MEEKQILSITDQIAYLKAQTKLAKKEREEKRKLLAEQKEKDYNKIIPPLHEVDKKSYFPDVFKEKKPTLNTVVEPKATTRKKKYGPYPRNYDRESITRLIRENNFTEDEAIKHLNEVREKKEKKKNPLRKDPKVIIDTFDGKVSVFYKVDDALLFLSSYLNKTLCAAKIIFYRDFYKKENKNNVRIYLGNPNN